ncbi:hypothetical protein INT44_004719 [Umbelopsis vinacea]|uniref:Uncharacterized protein n=1 Tax=Umbelopsis vinacea TaxID=44442 RepID=A0A8H7PFM3_9FUNG|nr:hypothetical protein INT44_004719 [Umbelopsis vinacea]
MYKALHWTGKQLDNPNTGYSSNIEAAYKELSDEEKKKINALYEELFRARYLDPERIKAEQNGAETKAKAEFHWSEDIFKLAFVFLAFYSAHTFAKGDVE